MKRALPLAICLLVAVMAWSQDEGEYRTWMQTAGGAAGTLKKNLDAKNGPAAAADARKLQEVFNHVHEFWQGKNSEDAMKCFVGFYLTLPASLDRFWQRWKQAWQVKWRASAFRVNFDLHRASGLWLWPLLFIFAWSGVMLNLPDVYHRVTDAIFEYRPPAPENMSVPVPGQARPPRLDFRAAIAAAQGLMAEQAANHGFSVGRPVVLQYKEDERKCFYNVHSSRDVWSRDDISSTVITFDADTGALRAVNLPTGEHVGNTISMWLSALHFAWVVGLPYRIFVCVLGLVIAMLSYTGVHIWWKRRTIRLRSPCFSPV